jgi:RNA recognition motif-containing protein
MNVSTYTVRISNLPEQFEEDDFSSMCQNINPKSKTRFYKSANGGEMDFTSKKEAERCIEEYDEMDIDGGCLRVEVILSSLFISLSLFRCVCACVFSLIFVDPTLSLVCARV